MNKYVIIVIVVAVVVVGAVLLSSQKSDQGWVPAAQPSPAPGGSVAASAPDALVDAAANAALGDISQDETANEDPVLYQDDVNDFGQSVNVSDF